MLLKEVAMKQLTVRLFILLLLCAASNTIKAQGGDASWVKVSPKGEQFTVQMPKSPAKSQQKNAYGDLSVDALVFTAVDGRTSYAVWSLKNRKYSKAKPPGMEEYLDACAELIWESLLKPLRDKIPEEPGYEMRMTYVTEFAGKAYPGREYRIRLDTVEGVTNFYVSGASIYVLMVLNAPPAAPDTLRFLKSFTGDNAEPLIFPPDKQPGLSIPQQSNNNVGSAEGMGLRPGRGDNNSSDSSGSSLPKTQVDSTNPNRVFNTREVGQKARIISRPGPQYTESARKFGVSGTVVLRGVFSTEGDVRNIKVMSRLPHGLTEQAILAARQIRFVPAQIDGRPVSQYIQIEYNFNLY
jgi:TonB family protein